MFKRSSGILMHVTSLPSNYGIGSFGEAAYSFVDFLWSAGQKYWQLLPIGPTGYGDSPYQSFSTFAGNPLLIDLDFLIEEGMLKEKDVKSLDFGSNESFVDYALVDANKMKLLKKSFKVGRKKYENDIMIFVVKNHEWLEDYALFMAIKEENDLRSWQEWPEDIKLRRPQAIEGYKKRLKETIEFYEYVQFLFFKQWEALKTYANSKDIEMVGDIPIYVAEDSSDTWAHPELFMLDENETPIVVSGCPPDAFSETGQLWGNPIYDWEYHKKTGFKWWIDRIKGNEKLSDVIRIDHFRGLESYWSIPYGDPTAEYGQWVLGPGYDLFEALKNALGDVQIIAEDLGYITKEVIALREKTNYPGMKVLQFAFDPREESDYLPHNYDYNCVVYTGTHDNDTVMGWMNSADQDAVNHAIDYLKLTEEEGYHWGYIRGAWSSVGNIAIAQMQDFIGLGSDCRMNIPSTIGNNWKWRVKATDLSAVMAKKIYDMTKLYGRV